MPIQFDKVVHRDRYTVQRDEIKKLHGRTAQPSLLGVWALNTPIDRAAVRDAHERCEDDCLNQNTYEPRHWKDVLKCVLLKIFALGQKG